MSRVKSLPTLSFNTYNIPILRFVLTITFHNSFPWKASMSWYPGLGVVLDCIDF